MAKAIDQDVYTGTGSTGSRLWNRLLYRSWQNPLENMEPAVDLHLEGLELGASLVDPDLHVVLGQELLIHLLLVMCKHPPHILQQPREHHHVRLILPTQLLDARKPLQSRATASVSLQLSCRKLITFCTLDMLAL